MLVYLRRWVWAGVAAAWLAAVVSGFAVVWRYAAAPGPQSHAPATWPEGTRLDRAVDRAQLVMFVHPHCSCSRASLTELGRLLERVRGRVQATVVFVLPQGVAPGWERSDLRTQAARLPDTVGFDDTGGEESRRFGAATSGATLLYDAAGRLLFSGGVTAMRGHQGNSFGEERVVALLQSGEADRRDSPVFGCPLDEEARP